MPLPGGAKGLTFVTSNYLEGSSLYEILEILFEICGFSIPITFGNPY
jgi:hypothetical protein